MKLRYQGTILLLVPLTCQLFFAFLIVQNFSTLDQAVRKEARAKEIIAFTQKIRLSIAQLVLEAMQGSNLAQIADNELDTKVSDIVSTKFAGIHKLVKGNHVAEGFANQYEKDLHELGKILGDLGELVCEADDKNQKELQGVFLTRYLSGTEQLEETRLCLQKLIRDEKALVAIYEPVVKEFEPKSIKQRERLLQTVIVAAAIDSAVAILFALYFGRNFVKRLAILMRNIHKFSSGEKQLEEVGGSDELSELNESFREMARKKQEAEDIKRSLSAMVAHDLRSPLNSATIMISVILQRKADVLDEWTRGRLTRLNSEINRLFRLANTLLDVEKLESNNFKLHLQKTNIHEIVTSSTASLEGMSAARQVPIEIDEAQQQEFVCDRERVIQVLVNLLSNAFKFAPKNSCVKLNTEVNGGRVLFEVIDSGPGVPQEQQSGLFQKFSQLDQEAVIKHTGSGIGLYISKMIVNAHGGDVGYREPLGGGSCFWFMLPLSLSSEAAEDQ